MTDRRRADGAWQPVRSTHRCERHMILGDVHCGKAARWRHAGTGAIACGGCKELAVRANS